MGQGCYFRSKAYVCGSAIPEVRAVSFRKPERWLPTVTGCAMFLACLAIARFGFQWMLVSRMVPWTPIVMSSALSLTWAVRLPALIPEMYVPQPAKLRAVAAAAAR
jgi:hypothetical protein